MKQTVELLRMDIFSYLDILIAIGLIAVGFTFLPFLWTDPPIIVSYPITVYAPHHSDSVMTSLTLGGLEIHYFFND